MTCVVGITHKSRVWIGGDSAGTAGWDQVIRVDEKVFVNGPMVFGFTTSFRMGQLLRYRLAIPDRYPDVDVMKFMCTSFVDAVRDVLKSGGFARAKDSAESGGTFLVGYQGRLFEIGSDYQVGESVDGYGAVGCGDSYALGSLYGSTGAPESRIEKAIEAASYFSAGVAGPVVCVSGGEA